jgi:peptidoglycan/xylan/chitin deacetylase (PgdA/CDA1 family)
MIGPMEPRALQWPGNARLAVMLTFMFEAWPDGEAPPYSPMTSPMRAGAPDRQGISWAEYGGRTGVARFLRILAAAWLHATFAINARAAEKFPDAVRAIAAGGHEIAGHGYTQDLVMPYLSAEEERALIRRCRDTLAQIGGVKPVGWASPRMTPSAHTADLLAADGFLWHGDYSDTDLPYVVRTAHGPLVALAHSDFTDNRALRASPRAFYDVYRDTATYLHREEPGGLMNLTMHAHFGGRPPMAAMLVEILAHLRALGEVWFPRHDELAALVMRSEEPLPTR